MAKLFKFLWNITTSFIILVYGICLLTIIICLIPLWLLIWMLFPSFSNEIDNFVVYLLKPLNLIQNDDKRNS